MNTSDAGTPFISPYRAFPGQDRLILQLARSRASLQQKLVENLRVASLMDHIDARVAGYLRSCRPGRYLCGLSKLCRFCGVNRTRELVKHRKNRLLALEYPYHLTLSTPSISKLTRRSLKDLADRTKSFRESRPIQRVIFGGSGNIEIAYSGDGCMPHLHAVVDGAPTVPIDLIRETWHGLGGGHQVHLRIIEKGTAPNVFGYSAQQPSLPSTVAELSDFYWVTRGMKLTKSWGTLHYRHGLPVKKLTIAPPEAILRTENP